MSTANSSVSEANPTAILYDHDGTIVDSLAVVVAATNEVLVANGLAPAAPAAVVAGMVLPTGPRLGRHTGDTDLRRQTELAEAFYAAAHRLPHLARPYPGIAALLAALHGRGVAQGVVSNNQGRFVRTVTAELGLAPWLGVQIGEEDMPAPKPDPRGLLLAAQRLGADPTRCWFVGDAAPDAQAAHAAGMRAVGVTWGTHSRTELLSQGFDLLVDRPDQILALLDR